MRSTQHLSAIAAALAIACLLTAVAAAEGAPDPKGAERPGVSADPETQAPAARSGDESARAAPQDRDSMLAELYAHLAKAPDAVSAAPIAQTIEGLWLHSGSETIGVLMRRALKAINEQRNDLAMKLLDAIVELAPDYAEGWSRRAYLYYLQNDFEHAIGDLRRALALEPNHFKALEGVARILRESGQKKSALGAYRQLLRIYPQMPGAQDAANELSTEVEGQGI
jgi:tetratricopeptide (TPR) repeat protein